MKRPILVGVAAFVIAAVARAANLVHNGDFSLDNTQFGSDYAFSAFSACNNTLESQYTVGTNPATWNCSSLVVSVGDHTTGTGNMLIANGGNTGLAVWFTTAPIAVAPNTTYYFEAWILNWSTTSVGPNAAQLTFRANGVDLATASATGAGLWTPVSTMWHSGAETTVSLTLFNGTPTSEGNDFAVDDIFFDVVSSITTTMPSTTTSPTSTTTSTTVTTTSTTLATDCAGIPSGPTFASILCRLVALRTATAGPAELGSLRPKLDQPLGKAVDRTQTADDSCAQSDAKHARQRLKQVIRQLIQYSHRLRSHAARKIPESVREPLAQTADGIGGDAKKLRGALHCPADAAGT